MDLWPSPEWPFLLFYKKNTYKQNPIGHPKSSITRNNLVSKMILKENKQIIIIKIKTTENQAKEKKVSVKVTWLSFP